MKNDNITDNLHDIFTQT